ncbi:MAG: hypothetical protein Q9M94_05830, partial [Candidatus Gracilibacteria bacterium]|nr:hypothetical protein [Candidatus Gracilibacteria bacterium]
LTSFMYQGSFNHSACKNSSFSIGFLLYFNILYTKIKFYLIDLRKSHYLCNGGQTGSRNKGATLFGNTLGDSYTCRAPIGTISYTIMTTENLSCIDIDDETMKAEGLLNTFGNSEKVSQLKNLNIEKDALSIVYENRNSGFNEATRGYSEEEKILYRNSLNRQIKTFSSNIKEMETEMMMFNYKRFDNIGAKSVGRLATTEGEPKKLCTTAGLFGKSVNDETIEEKITKIAWRIKFNKAFTRRNIDNYLRYMPTKDACGGSFTMNRKTTGIIIDSMEIEASCNNKDQVLHEEDVIKECREFGGNGLFAWVANIVVNEKKEIDSEEEEKEYQASIKKWEKDIKKCVNNNGKEASSIKKCYISIPHPNGQEVYNYKAICSVEYGVFEGSLVESKDFEIFKQKPHARANLNGNVTITLGESIMLDSSKSFDNDGEITWQAWTIKGNRFVLSYAEKYEYTPFSVGEYKFTLIVRDNDGLEGYYNFTIIVIPKKDDGGGDDGGGDKGEECFTIKRYAFGKSPKIVVPGGTNTVYLSSKYNEKINLDATKFYKKKEGEDLMYIWTEEGIRYVLSYEKKHEYNAYNSGTHRLLLTIKDRNKSEKVIGTYNFTVKALNVPLCTPSVPEDNEGKSCDLIVGKEKYYGCKNVVFGDQTKVGTKYCSPWDAINGGCEGPVHNGGNLSYNTYYCATYDVVQKTRDIKKPGIIENGICVQKTEEEALFDSLKSCTIKIMTGIKNSCSVMECYGNWGVGGNCSRIANQANEAADLGDINKCRAISFPIQNGGVGYGKWLSEKQYKNIDGKIYNGKCTSLVEVKEDLKICSGIKPVGDNVIKGKSIYQEGSTYKSWTYTENAKTDLVCAWKCQEGYVKDGNKCVEDNEGKSCDLIVGKEKYYGCKNVVFGDQTKVGTKYCSPWDTINGGCEGPVHNGGNLSYNTYYCATYDVVQKTRDIKKPGIIENGICVQGS